MGKKETINILINILKNSRGCCDYNSLVKDATAIFNAGFRQIPEGVFIVLTEKEMDGLVSRAYHEDMLKKTEKKAVKTVIDDLSKKRNAIGQLMVFDRDLEDVATKYNIKE